MVKVRPCRVCGKDVRVTATAERLGYGNFCSHVCFWKNRKLSPEDRFYRSIRTWDGSDCWTWRGSTVSRRGYGLIRVGNKKIQAHRFSWILHHNMEPIPEGLNVCHSCDNPGCVNPDHLWLGTRLENVRDMVKKDRHPKGERSGRALLTESQVREARELWKTGAIPRKTDIAKKYGLSYTAARYMLNGTNWGHVK